MIGISVVMPVYNVSQYLYNSIESIFEQTYKNIEIVCVDDGSTDDSLDILKQLQKKYDNINIISQKNAGPGVARNTGIKNAKGEYIAFLDADDIFLDQEALEKMYNAAKEYDADMVGANLKRINQDYSIDEYYDFINSKFTYFYKEDVLEVEEYGIPFAFYKNIFKRSFLNEHNITFPDIRAGEDPIFMVNVLVNTDEFPVLPLDLYGYNHSIGGGVNEKINNYNKKYDYLKHFKDSFDILKKDNKKSILSGYKLEFINYIIYSSNMQDDEILSIVRELFSNFEDYFEEQDYGYFLMDYIVNNDFSKNSSELDEFILIKKCLFEESCIEDNFINISYLKDYFKYVSNYEETDSSLIERSSFDKLLQIKTKTSIDSEIVKDEVKSLNNTLTAKVYNKNAEFLRKYVECRIDIKNKGQEDNTIILEECDDDLTHISQPAWFKGNDGEGTILSTVSGDINFSFKCVNDGELTLYFRGRDYRDKNGKRIPIYIDFKDIVVDGKNLVNDSRVSWHDNPFIYKKEVHDGQIIKVKAKWLPLNDDSNIILLSPDEEIDMLFNQSRIDLKNKGGKNNSIIVSESFNNEYSVEQPGWFKDDYGMGTVITSSKGVIDLSFKCVNDGELEINLRGIDFRDYEDNRIPIFIEYTNLVVDDEILLNSNQVSWHDDPIIYHKKVKDGQIINMHVEWSHLKNFDEKTNLSNKGLKLEDSTTVEIQQLLNEKHSLKHKNQELKELNDSLLNSNSWKLTKPLRMLKNFRK